MALDNSVDHMRFDDPAAKWRTAAAWLLLTLPLFAYPLEWGQALFGRFPLWDKVTAFTPGTMSLFAAAVLLLIGWTALRRVCMRSGVNMALFAAAGAVLFLSFVRSLYFKSRIGPEEFFLPLVPLAGMVLSREVWRILPRWGILVLTIFVLFTWRFPLYIGLPGNWNWNLSLLAVLLPAPFLLWREPPKRFWIPVLAAMIFLVAVSLRTPDVTPRGAMLGVAAASAALWLLWKLPGRQRFFIMILCGGAGLAVFLSIWLGTVDPAGRDNRIWLWRGSVELALNRGALGIGSDKFTRYIYPHLPREYFFSDHPVSAEVHPHNEFLALWCSHGLAGVAMSIVLVLAAVSGLRKYSSIRVWGFWMFVALLVHGQVDVLLQTPVAGTLWLTLGGALAGSGAKRGEHVHCAAGAIGVSAALLFAGVLFCSGWFARASLLSSKSGDHYAARRQLERSLALRETAEGRYRMGKIELFDFKDPDAALRHFDRLVPRYEHSHFHRGYAYVLKEDYKSAARCFDAETAAYPMSALNAYMKLYVMQKLGSDEASLASHRRRLKYLLKLRGKTLDALLADPNLDDLPLRNP